VLHSIPQLSAPAIADTDAPVILRLHAFLPRSHANGPGVRAVIWFQGCRLGCPGCFNPETHASDSRLTIPAIALAEDLAGQQSEIENITVSGGEPLEQPEGLLQLLTALRMATHLSTVLFSGYTLAETMKMAYGPRIFRLVDVLIAGPFVQARRIARGLRGSANQVVHLLTNRYTARDIANTPPGEVCIDPSGDIYLTGVAPRCPGPSSSDSRTEGE
jgi:anaerobic ribonucleoside-triphosphate reductase activating protein